MVYRYKFINKNLGTKGHQVDKSISLYKIPTKRYVNVMADYNILI
ncbi:hypothetical protein EV143_102241 [Flavobacterium chryseum]|nr:hypothetical protein EV143_102241 [Flavobacterium sp. P3160]